MIKNYSTALGAAAAVAAVGLTLALTTTAEAAATYDAGARIDLTLTSIVNLDTPGDLSALVLLASGDIDQAFSEATGTGAAGTDPVFDAPEPVAEGDILVVAAGATGSADKPGGTASSIAAATVLLDIFNESFSDTFELTFDVSYTAAATATASNPLFGAASALSFVELINDLGDVTIIDQVAAASGLPGDSPIDTLTSFTLTVLPFFSDTLRLNASASGSATSVPVPASLALLMAAFAVPMLISRKRSLPA